ncbi:metallo-beta-lactamase superfamily protein [Macrophomina phaseolina]|uniref:Metallo-beta-lactamase superfamily protein n=1 Tax=Macrophomina phaseolina TaxID=35725 RepID=A0ABQ8GX21_9PEZI|nr:metallo-beta-lactamase superfamily protein [Macrophomina phaseolina]
MPSDISARMTISAMAGMTKKLYSNFDEELWDDYLADQEALLPKLPDVEGLSPRVIRILGDNPGKFQLQGTNTYLVGAGRSRILIDTGQGMPIWASRIADVVRRQECEISHVLLTHWHGDHTGGVADLVRLYPHLGCGGGQRPIEDGQVFRASGVTVRAVYTPGHAIDHMCFVLEEEGAIFTGDNVLGHGFTVVEDLSSYMESLKIMESQGCRLGYPAHGIVCGNIQAKLKEYKEQQLGRERRVIQALKDCRDRQQSIGKPGKVSMSVVELARAIYGNIPEHVLKSAFAPMLNEMLMKLAADRKVAFELNCGERRWFAGPRS